MQLLCLMSIDRALHMQAMHIGRSWEHSPVGHAYALMFFLQGHARPVAKGGQVQRYYTQLWES